MKQAKKTTTKVPKKTVKEQIQAINETKSPNESVLEILSEVTDRIQKLGFNSGVLMVDSGVAMIGGHFGSPLTALGITEKCKQNLLSL